MGIRGMRAFLAVVLVSSSALAEPAPGVGTGAGSAAGPAALGTAAREQGSHYDPADRGGYSGIVIVPAPMPDALPYPRGMVVAPPDTGDRMANVLTRPWTWSTRSLWQRLGDGAGALWDALAPQHL
jgi:hypothetical protein